MEEGLTSKLIDADLVPPLSHQGALVFTAFFTRRQPVPPPVPARRRTWRIEFHANGVLIHGTRVEAGTHTEAVHRGVALATAELAMRGRSFKYESVVASLA